MKRVFLTMNLVILGICANLYAQDVIIKPNGDEIKAKVTKVNSNEIEYKRWTNQDGPFYTIDTRDVFMIKYANGEKDVFNIGEKQQITQQLSNASGPKYVKKLPAANNQQLIERYKTPVKFAKTPSTKDAHYFFPIMSMSDSSIVSNSDIEMKIIPTTIWNNYGCFDIKYSVELQNKTDKVIYIDLANTFRIYRDGTSKSYYNTEQTTVNHGSSSGLGFNLGGITNALGIGGALGTLAGSTTVGGSSQNSVSTTYANQRILTLPPHSKKGLTEYKQVKVKKHEYITVSDLETYKFHKDDLRGHLKKNGYISYSEDNSPYTATYIITYSTAQDFSEYSSLYAKLYTRYVYGEFLITQSQTKREKAIKEVQKYVSNFWEDPGIIVGGCGYIQKKK